jgi:hypothetical protein
LVYTVVRRYDSKLYPIKKQSQTVIKFLCKGSCHCYSLPDDRQKKWEIQKCWSQFTGNRLLHITVSITINHCSLTKWGLIYFVK